MQQRGAGGTGEGILIKEKKGSKRERMKEKKKLLFENGDDRAALIEGK